MSKSIFKNIAFKFLLNLFNLVVPILIGPYVLRKLGPDLMGAVNFSQTIFGYFFIFAGFGVYQYGLREISRVRQDKELLSKTFTSLFVFTGMTTIITTIAYLFFIKFMYSGTIVYTACMILTFNLIANIFYVEWINEALENYDFITIKTIVVRIIYIVLLFMFVKNAKDLKNYLYLLVLSTILNNIISYVYIKKSIKFNFKDIKIKRHIKPMFLVVILSNVNVLYTQLDKFLLGEFVGLKEVGYYGTAQNISTIISTLLLSVIHVTIPRLSHYIANDNDEEYINLLDKITKIYFLLLFPAAIGMVVLAKEIVLIYGGQEYVNAIPMLVVFSIYMITLGYETILGNQVMYIKKKEKEQVEMIFVGGFVNLILNILLLKMNLLNGTYSIITTMIANIVVILLECIYIKKKLNLDFNIFSLDKSKYLFIALLFIPITRVITNSFNNIFIVSLLSIVVNGSIYFGILLLIKDNTLMQLFDKVIIKFKK
ncbi:oligosaccharide flippase family protein [Clostridium sp. B9]|uniref:oligosaccharide flippase family protein n=1 Tax=Clostridium sp. B9 TaxID=3423224 RepID=UPI003D2ED85C